MRQLAFCLLAAIAFAACNKPEAAEEPAPTPVKSSPPAMAKRAAASPTPSAQDWMWKNKKGKPRDNDPLKVKDDGLEKPAKK